jgi:magnesium-transporting ATPase (P-type)
MCQQKFTQKQYDQIMQQYEAKRRFRKVNNEDLNGFPSNNYCFIGLFSLLNPPRVDVSDSVLKIRRAHIRVAMITGDHPTTATAIGKQVHILSPEISERNGVDTFKIEQNESGHLVLQLCRNETLLQQHVTREVTPFTTESKAVKQIEVDTGKSDLTQQPPWYKRCCSLCKNQLSGSESVLKQETEKEKIPYAIVVSL